MADYDDYLELKTTQLVDRCRHRPVTTSGNKKELIEQLVQDDLYKYERRKDNNIYNNDTDVMGQKRKQQLIHENNWRLHASLNIEGANAQYLSHMSNRTRSTGGSVRYDNEAKVVKDGRITKRNKIMAQFDEKMAALNDDVRAGHHLIARQPERQLQHVKNEHNTAPRLAISSGSSFTPIFIDLSDDSEDENLSGNVIKKTSAAFGNSTSTQVAQTPALPAPFVHVEAKHYAPIASNFPKLRKEIIDTVLDMSRNTKSTSDIMVPHMPKIEFNPTGWFLGTESNESATKLYEALGDRRFLARNAEYKLVLSELPASKVHETGSQRNLKRQVEPDEISSQPPKKRAQLGPARYVCLEVVDKGVHDQVEGGIFLFLRPIDPKKRAVLGELRTVYSMATRICNDVLWVKSDNTGIYILFRDSNNGRYECNNLDGRQFIPGFDRARGIDT